MSIYTNDRKERGKKQNLYLIECLPETDDVSRSYIIMGSSGNVYTVRISSLPTCNCPDYQKRQARCKHIYFVLLRIMKVTDEDKKSYSKIELANMFNNIPKITNNLLVDDSIKNKYSKISAGQDISIEQKSTDDLCPICLDDLENGDEIDYCKYSCGKPVHLDCFQMWSKSRGNSCVFCRESWDLAVAEKGAYVNLLSK